MPTSPLEAAGAAIQPTAAAPLHTNEFFTGMWTNGNPLGPGPVPYLYQKFYSASRYDRLVGGNDIEISPRLTLIRRPGHNVYNSSLFPPANRFYEFRGFTQTLEIIRLLGDFDAGVGSAFAGTVRECTQPSTNHILWTKDPAALRTGFVSDGNILYAGDGITTHKWISSGEVWTAAKAYANGQFIIDPNGNIQMAIGPQTATIVAISIDAGSYNSVVGFMVDLYFPPGDPAMKMYIGERLTPSGLTTVPAMNGVAATLANIIATSHIQIFYPTPGFPGLPGFLAKTTETGTVTTGTGITGSTPPVWNTVLGGITLDGTAQWQNKGSAVQPWGGDGPTTAPIVTQVAAPSIYPTWAAATWYAPLFVIVDSNGRLQQLKTAGVTGSVAPAWATATGAVTTESTGVQWTCKGSAAWVASHAYNVGDTVQAAYTYSTTSTYFDHVTKQWVTQSTSVSVTSLFQVVTAGISQTPGPPHWINGLGTRTVDGSVTWVNQGTAPAWPGAGQLLSLTTQVIDTFQNLETVQTMGKSQSPGPPTWSTVLGDFTTDGTITWQNSGPYGAANTDAWMYSYSGKNSATGDISNPSPPSQPIVVAANNQPVIQGTGLPNPPWDVIILWRTEQGGSTFLYLDEFPNPGPGKTWVYTDTNPDSALNTQFPAPVPGNNGNDAPPAGFIPECYYLGRIWGYVANQLRWSGGPDTVTGNGNSTFPTKNRFTFPARGVVCWPTSIGLICITTSDIWAVLGQGTPDAPFYVVMFQAGIGMLSSDAFAVNGSTSYAMLTSHQLVSMDPGAGEVEVGFPIADIFDEHYDPALAYVTWHQGFSKDTALYVANGHTSWYRMAAVAAPESGNVWSPAATIHSPGRVRATASIEFTPGVKKLIVGPDIDGYPILMRDSSTNDDNGAIYAADALISAMVLAQPGTTAGFQFCVTEEKMIDGARPLKVSVLFDEIFGAPHVTMADFRVLRNITNDPPNLPRAKSVMVQRHWASQDPSTIIKCRYYQQDISWPAENEANEIYTNTIYGRLPEKARK
jgi:hypothetical protein